MVLEQGSVEYKFEWTNFGRERCTDDTKVKGGFSGKDVKILKEYLQWHARSLSIWCGCYLERICIEVYLRISTVNECLVEVLDHIQILTRTSMNIKE